MRVPSLPEVRRLTEKQRDAWWTVLLVDPVATPLVRWTAMWTRVTPNQITWAALVLGIGAAACFAQGDWQWLVAGAVIYHVSFILDCMDGKLARLKGNGSAFGAWLDYIFDRVRVLVCAIALMGGQYRQTEDVTYIWLAVAVVFLDMLRYMDALEIWKVRLDMRRKLRERAEELGLAEPPAMAKTSEEDEGLPDAPAAAIPAQAAPASPPSVPQQQTFITRLPGYVRLRDFLVGHRIRIHLFSGIEFQMTIFIIAPLANSILWPTVAAGVLLLLFEVLVVYRLFLATRSFERTMAGYDRIELKTKSEQTNPADQASLV
ncbi:CDP-alcohol phosphatidyltransferase family protein [Streptomyces sp. CHD11]|uniref:CDP-alcohol phosphatidyltransferase family protein n=1 Tax=Streptomyces sp. CHD11 TaxID=2741325 RepID=UPI001BFC2B27|nr:CDP-alcohol phosphatidyltransferase family protein [Streptomyces sp. CHD11]MBT3155587.1 CDP-alcohol phosphatidyltransferase family protein [Streptomyces sp. CHD11]